MPRRNRLDSCITTVAFTTPLWTKTRKHEIFSVADYVDIDKRAVKVNHCCAFQFCVFLKENGWRLNQGKWVTREDCVFVGCIFFRNNIFPSDLTAYVRC